MRPCFSVVTVLVHHPLALLLLLRRFLRPSNNNKNDDNDNKSNKSNSNSNSNSDKNSNSSNNDNSASIENNSPPRHRRCMRITEPSRRLDCFFAQSAASSVSSANGKSDACSSNRNTPGQAKELLTLGIEHITQLQDVRRGISHPLWSTCRCRVV